MNNFKLHPQLESDTINIGRFPLSLLLLHKDANYPWFILVPRQPDLTEIYQLNEMDRAQLMKESCTLAEALEAVFTPTKLNLATIGNMVPQLHYHHVVRFDGDPAWPGPVWGAVPAIEYDPAERAKRIKGIVNELQSTEFLPSD